MLPNNYCLLAYCHQFKVTKYFIALILVIHSAFALAQMPDFYNEPGRNPFRSYNSGSLADVENVDPFTGKLQLHHTDVFIPGNGGLDLKVSRSYTSRSFGGLVGQQWVDSWSMHFGYVTRKPDQFICSTGLQVSNKINPVLVLPDGNTQVLSDADGGGFITPQFWKASCISNGLLITSPEGTRYQMDYQAISQNEQRYYATKITDRNGNSITIAYSNHNGNGAHVTRVSTSDGRSITYSYDTDSFGFQTLKFINSPSGTTTYTYTPVLSGGQLVKGAYFLSKVTRPDGLAWQYAYNDDNAAAGAYSIKKITSPSGATADYSYAKKVFYPSVGAPQDDVVSTKTISSLGNWSYNYFHGSFFIAKEPPESVDWTEVIEPTRVVTYAHYGAAAAPQIGGAWKIGLLRYKSIGTRRNVIDYAESYQWSPITVSQQNNQRNYSWVTMLDEQTYAPVTVSKTIYQRGTFAATVGYKTTFSEFDSFGNPGKVVEAGSQTRTITRKYDINTDRWLLHQLKEEVLPEGFITSYLRDNKGNVTNQNRYGIQTNFQYTNEGDIFSITDANNHSTTFQSYVRGIPQKETYPDGSNITRTVNPTGTIASETDSLGNTIAYKYDSINRPTFIDRPIGNDVSIAWSATSRQLTRGNYSETTNYDTYGRPKEIFKKDTTTGKTIAVTMQHDALGNKTFESLPGQASGNTYTYDVIGRVLNTKYADGKSTSYSYSDSNHTVTDEVGGKHTYLYRAFGDPDNKQLMSVIPPSPYRYFDFEGELIPIKIGSSAGQMDFTRNIIGQPLSITQDISERTFSYSRSLLISETNPETDTTIYGRDAVGNMTSRQVGTNPPTTYQYDANNRLTGITYPGTTPPVSFTYDKSGQVVKATIGTGSQEITKNYTYDANRNLKTEQLAIDGNTYQASYAYNANDVLSGITYPSGQQVAYSINAFGNTTAAAPFVTSVSYNAIEKPESILLTNGVKSQFGYNARQWPSAMGIAKGVLALAASTYGYDDKGNLDKIVDTVEPAYNRNFRYDFSNRLIGADGDWGAGNISYDDQGNILSQNYGSFSITHIYDDLNNRLTNVSGSNNLTLDYDGYGNVIRKGNLQFLYDDASNLRCVNCSKTSKVKYDYDANQMRVKKLVGSTPTYYFYGLSGNLLSEMTPTRQKTKDYFYLANKLLAEKEQTATGSTVTYLHNDIVGSPIAATNVTGALVWREHYTPYGERNNKSVSAAKDTRWFTGKPQDPESGLSYFGARYYDPILGRFMGMDPVGIDENNVHSHNRYAYGNNNPNRFVDRDGNIPVETVWDALNVGLGIASFNSNWSAGNYGSAAIDALGVIVDSAATVVPYVPGGLGTIIKSTRAADEALDIVSASKNYRKPVDADLGTIYIVPGEFTLSGLPYVGSADNFDEVRKFYQGDGRIRTEATMWSTFPIGDKVARRSAEQRAIIMLGGLSQLDNKRNEIAFDKLRKNGLDFD